MQTGAASQKTPQDKLKRTSPDGRATLKTARVASPTTPEAEPGAACLELGLRFWIPPWSFSRLFCGSAKLECAHPENAAETSSIRHFVPRESRRKPCKALHPCVQPGKSRRESQECPERRVVFMVLGWGCGGNDFTVFFALFAMPCSSQRNAHDVSLGFRVFCFSSCAA